MFAGETSRTQGREPGRDELDGGGPGAELVGPDQEGWEGRIEPGRAGDAGGVGYRRGKIGVGFNTTSGRNLDRRHLYVLGVTLTNGEGRLDRTCDWARFVGRWCLHGEQAPSPTSHAH